MLSEIKDLVESLLTSIPASVLVVAALLAAVLVFATFAKARNGLILVGAMLFTASIGAATFDEQFVRPQLLGPIQAARSELFGAIGLLLGIGTFAHLGLHPERRIPAQAILLLIIGLYAALLRMVHEGPASGVISVVLTLVTIIPLTVLIPRIIDGWDDIVVLLRMIVIVNVVWMGVVFVQALADPGAMVVGRERRFFGPTGNPQQAAIILGMNAALMIWLFSNDWRRSLRFTYALLAGLNAVGVLWTGSRTGLVLFIIGLCGVAYARIGRTILFLPLGMLGLYAGWTALGALGVDLAAASRVTSLQDTRSEAWLQMIDSARESPLIGVGVEQAGSSENSYLYAWASYGVGMVFLVVTLALVSVAMCLRLFRLRWRLDQSRRAMIDVVLAYNAMYFIGGLVEGYMLARVSSNLVLLIVFAAMASRIEEMAAAEALEPVDDGYEDGDEYEYEHEHEHEHDADAAEFPVRPPGFDDWRPAPGEFPGPA
jgi:hypothetical protein